MSSFLEMYLCMNCYMNVYTSWLVSWMFHNTVTFIHIISLALTLVALDYLMENYSNINDIPLKITSTAVCSNLTTGLSIYTHKFYICADKLSCVWCNYYRNNNLNIIKKFQHLTRVPSKINFRWGSIFT